MNEPLTITVVHCPVCDALVLVQAAPPFIDRHFRWAEHDGVGAWVRCDGSMRIATPRQALSYVRMPHAS